MKILQQVTLVTIKDERTALNKRREKLIAFIMGELYRQLPAVEQMRLRSQLDAMTTYSNILGERIEAMKEADTKERIAQ